MTDLHPLTEKILGYVDTEDPHVDIESELDEIVREHLTPPPVVAGSGVRFPDMPDTLVTIAGNFIESGNQMQMAIIGTEPILVVQPEYDADENEVTLITTAVDLPPAGLIHVLEAMLDGVREIVRIQSGERERDIADAEAEMRQGVIAESWADEAFELAQLPETPEG